MKPRPHDSSSSLEMTRMPSPGKVFLRLIRGFRVRVARGNASAPACSAGKNAFFDELA